MRLPTTNGRMAFSQICVRGEIRTVRVRQEFWPFFEPIIDFFAQKDRRRNLKRLWFQPFFEILENRRDLVLAILYKRLRGSCWARSSLVVRNKFCQFVPMPHGHYWPCWTLCLPRRTCAEHEPNTQRKLCRAGSGPHHTLRSHRFADAW